MRNKEVEEAATMMLESKGWIHESELPDLTYAIELVYDLKETLGSIRYKSDIDRDDVMKMINQLIEELDK